MNKKVSKKKPLFVLYRCRDEVIVTTPKDQKKTIKLCFTDGGRSLDDYDVDLIYDFVFNVMSTVAVN